MFVKCANGSCPSPFYYSVGAIVFEVRRCTGEPLEPGEAPIVYHWFCQDCLPILLRAWFDHGAGGAAGGIIDAGQQVRLVSLDSVLKDAEARSRLPEAEGPHRRALQAS